jgi:hypothetical protein
MKRVWSKEKRGLPKYFYVKASLLKALRLAGKAMNLSPDTVDDTIVSFYGGKTHEDLDEHVRLVESLEVYSKDASGTWSSSLKKTKQYTPVTTSPIPNHLRRKAISDKDAQVRVMDALICTYFSFTMVNGKLPWTDKKTRSGTVFKFLTFDDSQSPNDHLIVFKIAIVEYRILLRGRARKVRTSHKKKVGKTVTNEISKETEVVSAVTIDGLISEAVSESKTSQIKREVMLADLGITSSSPAGYQLGD